MYEFQYRPSFVSDMRPKSVIGDHGDDLFSVWGAPFLKGIFVGYDLGGVDPGVGCWFDGLE